MSLIIALSGRTPSLMGFLKNQAWALFFLSQHISPNTSSFFEGRSVMDILGVFNSLSSPLDLEGRASPIPLQEFEAPAAFQGAASPGP